MTGPQPGVPSGIGPRERRWLVIFLVLGSGYFALLLLERALDVVGGFGSIVIVVFLAWLLAFVMSPLVAWLEQRFDAPRGPIVVATYLLVLIVLGFMHAFEVQLGLSEDKKDHKPLRPDDKDK
jgi:predicted PurR-regulated permease PerM